MKNFESVKQSLKELLQIESVKGDPKPGMPFGEQCFQALDYTLKLGESMGFKTKNVDGYAGHIEWGEGELIGVLTHVDVVPVGKDWTVPPFSALEKDGKIYGRGTSDDKGPTIAVLYAMKTLKDEGFVPNKKVRLIVGSDEESGWSCIDHYFKKEEMPKYGFSPDGDFPVINCEKGVLHLKFVYPYVENFGITSAPVMFGSAPSVSRKDFELIHLGAGERVNMVPDYARAVFKTPLATEGEKLANGTTEIICKGVSAHGSRPDEGDSALRKLFAKIAEVTDNELLHFINDVVLFDNVGSKMGLNLSDEVSGKLTFNVGTCDFSDGKITLGVDIRYPVTFDKEFILGLVRENSGAEVFIQTYHRPLYVKEEEPLIQKLLEAYHKVTGKEKKCLAVGGATYSRALDCAVAFGPEFPGTVPTLHKADENVLVSELSMMCDIYYEALKSLLE